MDMNTTTIEGNIANIKVNADETFASFSLAYNSSYKGEDGQEIRNTHWFRIVGFKQTAGYVNRNLNQGDKVLIFGHLSTSEFEGDEGEDVKLTQIVADSIRIIFKKGEPSNEANEPAAAPTSEPAPAEQDPQPQEDKPKAKSPTAKMIAAAKTLAKKLDMALPQGYDMDFKVCSEFIGTAKAATNAA